VVTRRVQVIVALTLVLIGGAALDWWWYSGSTRHPRVLLIGVDGADPATLDRLIGQGRLPTFERLRREGAYGRLRSREPLLSPVIWTTIATGRTPQDHGVLDFVTRSQSQAPVAASRRCGISRRRSAGHPDSSAGTRRFRLKMCKASRFRIESRFTRSRATRW
jgi:hypothetical protein